MKLVEVRHVPGESWWLIFARCTCWCGHVTRAITAATLEAAVWRFRFVRREAEIVQEQAA